MSTLYPIGRECQEISGRKEGEIFGMQLDVVKICKWIDECPVLLITTNPDHNENLQYTGNHNRNEKKF